MTSVATGQQAEVAAAEYLKKRGFEILERNWRTRFCEIDIVARKRKTIHFVEVKYRIRNTQGSGLDFITPTKIRQMQFAAELWVNEHDWSDDYVLSALEVSGLAFDVTNFIPDCA